MRPRRLLRLLSDFDCKIRYHPEKASVAADALSRNERAKPPKVRALVMTINSNLPPQIHKAQVESLKTEKVKDENLHGMDKELRLVSPWKGVIRSGKRGKLNPRYIKPFRIPVKVGSVAYRLEPPEQLSRFHSTFRVSNQKKYLSGETLAIQLDEIQIDDTLYSIEEPV
ncbi:hypothetical protein Tco_1451591 [Tanacetum coccineum]